jgi:guanylate kinase
VILRRLDAAREELSHAGEFKYAIINKDFETAKQELAEIIQKERTRPHGANHR